MALTIQQIIDEANERYPNALTVDSQLRKISEREKQLERTIFRTKTATTYDIVGGQFLYPLDYSKNKIIYVLVNDKKYTYEEIDDDSEDKSYYYTYENSIGLYPTPDTTIANGLFIYHYIDPKTYTTGDLGSNPGFDQDFHMLHVYGLCADMAEIDQRFDVANGFIKKYTDLLNDYKRTDAEPELSPIRVG